MKASQYNIIINKPPYSYWYNSLTKSFFRVSKSLGDKLSKYIHDFNDMEKIPQPFITKLFDGGFIINDDVNEIEIIRNLNKKKIEEKNYFLVILPTLNCNFNCWYCIQDHVQSKMSEQTLSLVKQHIDYMVNVEKIDALHLEWFGGEPFMYFDEVIAPISNWAMELCDKSHIPFKNTTTTNGYFWVIRHFA